MRFIKVKNIYLKNKDLTNLFLNNFIINLKYKIIYKYFVCFIININTVIRLK